MENSIISGAFDLHVHTSPDYQLRKLDDVEMAKQVIAAGMGGYAIKSHSGCTTDRAHIINQMFPACKAIGTITLNNYHGGLNPLAVELAARMGAKIVWFPTTDSASAFDGYTSDTTRRNGYAGILMGLIEKGIDLKPVKVLDENGEILPAVYDVLEIIRQNDLILGTGHLVTEEIFALVKAARKQGVRKIVITHISSKSPFRACVGRDMHDLDVQRELLDLGVYMEHSALPVLRGWLPIENMIAQIKQAGPDRVIVSSDLGQADGKYPVEGFLEFCNKLLEFGISEKDVRKMIVHTPTGLLEL